MEEAERLTRFQRKATLPLRAPIFLEPSIGPVADAGSWRASLRPLAGVRNAAYDLPTRRPITPGMLTESLQPHKRAH
jgi:hypothetical protein